MKNTSKRREVRTVQVIITHRMRDPEIFLVQEDRIKEFFAIVAGPDRFRIISDPEGIFPPDANHQVI
jgi:hypothetical protein